MEKEKLVLRVRRMEIKRKAATNNVYTPISPMRADCAYTRTFGATKRKNNDSTIQQIKENEKTILYFKE